MHASSHRLGSKLFSTLLAVTLFLTFGPVVRTIAELHRLLAQISLQLCEIGLVVLRVCGI